MGDAFHLVPRVLNYFLNADLTSELGIGKLITSVTMTVFYVLMLYIWIGYYENKKNRALEITIWSFAAIRFLLCLFPQNGWLQNSSDMTWGIIRNIPFVILGTVICALYFRDRSRRTGSDFCGYTYFFLLLSIFPWQSVQEKCPCSEC